MKSIHPDVSRLDEEAATKAATALNLAYEAALEALGQEKIRGPGSFAPMDEFDRTLGPPCELFVNPFASNSDVMLWREIQQVARGSSDPEAALRLRGVFMRPSAIQYVTVEQLQALYEQLAHMEATMDFESTAWFLTDMLARARRSNDRQQPRS